MAILEFFKRLFAGAGIGFLVGGPVGAIFGAAVAGSMSRDQDILGANIDTGKQRIIFTSNLTVLFTLVAKADDSISPQEARAIGEFFKDYLNFGESELGDVRKIMKETLRQNPSAVSVAREFAKVSTFEERLTLLRILWKIAGADGPVSRREQGVIQEIARGMGIRIEEQRSTQAEFVSSDDHDYRILGLKKTASDTEIKAAYKKMAKQYHPDRVAHLGEDYTKLAHEKFAEINRAYDAIRKKRGF